MDDPLARAVTLILVMAAGPLAARAAAPHTYAVETGVPGVVDLYDLSSVSRAPGGFSILDVATSDDFPRVFGHVAYRVSRETYRCGGGAYVIAEVRDYGPDGRLIDALAASPHAAMRVVAATAGSEMYDRFCPAGTAGELPGLAPARTVTADSPFAAYRIARARLGRSRAAR